MAGSWLVWNSFQPRMRVWPLSAIFDWPSLIPSMVDVTVSFTKPMSTAKTPRPEKRARRKTKQKCGEV